MVGFEFACLRCFWGICVLGMFWVTLVGFGVTCDTWVDIRQFFFVFWVIWGFCSGLDVNCLGILILDFAWWNCVACFGFGCFVVVWWFGSGWGWLVNVR